MDDLLARLPNRLRGMLEVFFAAIPDSKFKPDAVSAQWFNEIRSSLRVDRESKSFAPDQYTLSMHPDDYSLLSDAGGSHQAKLAASLGRALEAAGLAVIREPHVTLATDPTLPRWQVRVIAWHSSDPARFTEVMEEEKEPVEAETPPPGAFFIVEGQRHFPLDRTLINIGRQLDNQLVLEDARVSRRHAQLRVQKGRYVLLDLNSTAGTQVNGDFVREAKLSPGDVVTIATIQLIYGEDTGGPPEETPPYAPPFKPSEAIDRDQLPDTTEFEWSQKPTNKFDKKE